MTRITTKLAGLGFGLALALSLVALPPLAGAESNEALMSQYPHHRFFFSEEEVWRTQDEATASYAMIEVTHLEQIAGRTNLDLEMILFLEDNLWEYDSQTAFAGEVDATRVGVYGIDLDMFSDEIFWQDRVEPYAGFAQGSRTSLYPHPDDVPHLRRGELNY